MHDVVVGQHHALGAARGARGVEHHAHVRALALGDLVEPPAGGAGVVVELAPAQVLDVGEGVQVGVVVAGEPALLLVDDGVEARHALGDGDDLVDLLLVLHDGELHLGVVEDVGHLVGHRVLVDRHGDAADALHRREGRVEARAVVADDGHRVAAVEPQLAQAERRGAAPRPCSRAQVQVCQIPRSLWRKAGRAPNCAALRSRSLGTVSKRAGELSKLTGTLLPSRSRRGLLAGSAAARRPSSDLRVDRACLCRPADHRSVTAQRQISMKKSSASTGTLTDMAADVCYT